jgi:hypothetical protein
MSGISAREGLSLEQEAQFIAAAARVFRSGFPNPRRSGCPSPEVLRAVTRKKQGVEESEIVFEHLTCCSPCFADYEGLLRKEKLSRNLKLLALCASLLITVGVALWLSGRPGREGPRQPEPKVVQQPPAPQPPAPIQYEVAVVDLRNRAPVRGEQQPTPAETVVASLEARPLELSVILPIGSEESGYELQILRPGETPLVASTGSAVLENRSVILRLRTDLTGFPSGRYLLGIRKATFQWAYFPIRLIPQNQ